MIAFSRYALRLLACGHASRAWASSKIVADYMYDQANMRASDPATMESCNYPIGGMVRKKFEFAAPAYATQVRTDPEKDDLIDIGKIWRCTDKSLGPELKDTCLSFSLFLLLRRRFFGFACDESNDRAHKFVFKVLLAENEDGTPVYNRVFKLIELELAFMYDSFFTKSAVTYYASTPVTLWSLASAIGISVMAYVTVRAPVKITKDNVPIVSRVSDDIAITLAILASTALLEFLQVLLFWTGIWGRVSFVRQYLIVKAKAVSNTGASKNNKCRRGSGYIIMVKEFLAKIGLRCASNKHYWQHKLGQYSLLDSFSYNPNPSEHGQFGDRLLAILGLQKNHQVSKVRSAAGKSDCELPAEVKEALIASLIHTDGALGNGSFSVSNGAPQLSWACAWIIHTADRPSSSQRNQNQTHIILTWHIATWYCEKMALSADRVVAQDIATKLSKYCAHLVVCAPALLPGHPFDTSQKFDAAAVEAVKKLEKEENKYEAMKGLPVPEKPESIFESGLKLGKQLEEMEEGVRWKVLADFWAEMILYLAPSDNVQEHVERLAKGGEFITHLWALLSNAGILERDQEPPAAKV